MVVLVVVVVVVFVVVVVINGVAVVGPVTSASKGPL